MSCIKDTSTHPGWDRTCNPPTARRLLLPPEPGTMKVHQVTRVYIGEKNHCWGFKSISSLFFYKSSILLHSSLPARHVYFDSSEKDSEEDEQQEKNIYVTVLHRADGQ